MEDVPLQLNSTAGACHLACSQALCSLQTGVVSGGGWSGDTLKSQEGIFKTICKEGLCTRLSGLPSACITSLFSRFYSSTWAADSHPTCRPGSPRTKPSFVHFELTSPPGLEGGKQPGIYPQKQSRACTELNLYGRKRLKQPMTIGRGSARSRLSWTPFLLNKRININRI